MSLRAALRHSCNVYFFHAALAAGPDAVVASARAAGLGRPSGIDLDGEAAGLVPDRDWKRRAHRDDWRDGDTCNLAIGQGALLATPLQMAVVAAAVANAGRVPTPRLLGGVRDPGQETFRPVASAPLRDLAWDPSAARLVREGMRDVVMAEDGTGRKARIEGVTAAGKTGTAEYGPRDARRNRGWMIAFAPYDAPHYAIAVVLEDAESGGTTVAPVVRRILEGLFRVEAEPGREADG
jgi:penicillin-binding protein 2